MSTNFGETSVNIKWADMGVIEETARKVALKGLKKLGFEILGEAKKQVPVDTGTLMRSGEVSQESKTGTVKVSFNTPYARRQHEEHSAKAKYLERPFNELKGKATLYAEREIVNYYIKKNYGEYKS